MAKDSFYFPHDFNARHDDKMQVLMMECGAAGYGIFWGIIEILHEEKDHKIEHNIIFEKSFSKQMSTNVEQVLNTIQVCLTLGLLKKDIDFIYSDRVNANMKFRESISKSRSDAGKQSALKRALNKEIPTNAEQVSTSVEQNPTKPNKEKKRKEKKIKENKEYVIPSFEDFYKYYKESIQTKFPTDEFNVKTKYDTWVENDWRDGHDNEINNWKLKLRSVAPYLPVKKQTQIQGGMVY
jgi:hypothetical protein